MIFQNAKILGDSAMMRKINPPYKFDDIRPKVNCGNKNKYKGVMKFIEMFNKYIKLPKQR